jgi:type II secretory pathway pseudopilin PulG
VTTAGPRRDGEAGFSLVALFAAMTIMLILMGAAMPSWKYVMQNEREQELFFRGDQIASAIERYQKKNGGAAPTTIEMLVKGKFLRKAYKDPMAKDGKWRLVRANEVTGPRRSQLAQARAAMGGIAPPSPSPDPGKGGVMTGPGGTQLGPFIGVASYSTDKSLRIMNGAEAYDEWLFVAGRPRVLGRQLMPDVGGPATGKPGQPPVPPPGSPSK